MDPQQELFTAILEALRAKGYDVYDEGLPPEGTPYPFIYMGENLLNDEGNKTAVFGTVTQTIHVWSNNPKKRGTVSGMLLDIKITCRELQKTGNFKWDVAGINQEIRPDETTSEPLLHGVLNIDMRFS